MAKLSRVKGRAFEQKIARILRDKFPDTMVKRAIQSLEPWQSDVYFFQGPPVLRSLWLECNDSAAPNPAAKMAQAVRDINAAVTKGYLGDASMRVPVVVWHKKHTLAINATLTLSDLMFLASVPTVTRIDGTPLVTIAFTDLLDLL